MIVFGNFDYAWYLAIILSFVATLLHLPIDEKPIKTRSNNLKLWAIFFFVYICYNMNLIIFLIRTGVRNQENA